MFQYIVAILYSFCVSTGYPENKYHIASENKSNNIFLVKTILKKISVVLALWERIDSVQTIRKTSFSDFNHEILKQW